MADKKFVSLKICGNPESHSGYQTLILFNSPNFKLLDTTHVGFDGNSYFFSVLIDAEEVVYTLFKNNVRSYGAIRPGTLQIAISIPRGYCLDGGVSPADVLLKLKDKFLYYCMTCKDSTMEVYEFNEDRINLHVLDEVAKEFTLVPCTGAYNPMTPGCPVGYVIANETQTAELMKDIQYPEFKEYSLLIVGEKVGMTNYTPIANIQIPRVHQYSVYVDNNLRSIETDVTKTLKYDSDKNQKCYDNHSVSFRIDDILKGQICSGVSYDAEREAIHVSVANLAKPKTVRVSLGFSNNQIRSHFHPGNLTLWHSSNKVYLTNNLDFTLKGEEILLLDNPSLFQFITTSDKYEIKGMKYSEHDKVLNVQVEEKRQVHNHNYSGVNNQITTANSDLIDITIEFDKDNKDRCGTILISKCDEEPCFEISSEDLLKEQNYSRYVGHIYLPRSIFPSTITVSFYSKHHYFKKSISAKENSPVLIKYKDFECEPLSFPEQIMRNHKALLTIVISLIIGIIIGFVSGYYSYNVINNDQNEDSTSHPIDEITQSGGAITNPNSSDGDLVTPPVEINDDNDVGTSAINAQDTIDAANYLDSNNVWNKDEMEDLPLLQGLFDAMNNFEFETLSSIWAEKLSRSEKYNEIIQSCKKVENKLRVIRFNVQEFENISGKGVYCNDKKINITNYKNHIEEKAKKLRKEWDKEHGTAQPRGGTANAGRNGRSGSGTGTSNSNYNPQEER